MGARPIGPEVKLDVTRANQTHSGSIEYVGTNTATLMDWYEPHCGPDRSSIPTIRIAHRRSWEQLGAAYHQVVREAIDSGSNLVQTIRPRGRPSDDQKLSGHSKAGRQSSSCASHSSAPDLRRAIDAIANRVRYTGWSLGVLAIQPAKPDEVLIRRYGDCKDQSTLLVALLNQMGIDAKVALVRTGRGLDISPNLPTLSGFDHAIVAVVDRSQPSGYRFIDPTIHCGSSDLQAPVHFLSESTRGRWALVCSEKSELVRTPVVSVENEFIASSRVYVCNSMGVGTMGACYRHIGGDAFGIPSPQDPANHHQLRRVWSSWMESRAGRPLAYGHSSIPQHSQTHPEALIVLFSEQAQMMDRQSSCVSLDLPLEQLFASNELIGWFLPDAMLDEENPGARKPFQSATEDDAAANDDGTVLPAQQRRTAIVCQQGKTITYRLGVQLPEHLDVHFDEGESEQRIGMLHVRWTRKRIEAPATRGPTQTSDFGQYIMFANQPFANQPSHDEQLAGVTWQQAKTGAFDGLGHANDQRFLYECTFTIHPGSMTPDELRNARETFQTWIDEERFAFRIDANWSAADGALTHPTVGASRN